MTKKCFLCNSHDDVLDFNDKTYRNCSLKLKFRKKKNFKYSDVELPGDESRDFVGYHTTCYKKVTVLCKKYNEEFDSFVGVKTIPVATMSVSTEHLNVADAMKQTSSDPANESDSENISLTFADIDGDIISGSHSQHSSVAGDSENITNDADETVTNEELTAENETTETLNINENSNYEIMPESEANLEMPEDFEVEPEIVQDTSNSLKELPPEDGHISPINEQQSAITESEGELSKKNVQEDSLLMEDEEGTREENYTKANSESEEIDEDSVDGELGVDAGNSNMDTELTKTVSDPKACENLENPQDELCEVNDMELDLVPVVSEADGDKVREELDGPEQEEQLEPQETVEKESEDGVKSTLEEIEPSENGSNELKRLRSKSPEIEACESAKKNKTDTAIDASETDDNCMESELAPSEQSEDVTTDSKKRKSLGEDENPSKKIKTNVDGEESIEKDCVTNGDGQTTEKGESNDKDEQAKNENNDENENKDKSDTATVPLTWKEALSVEDAQIVETSVMNELEAAKKLTDLDDIDHDLKQMLNITPKKLEELTKLIWASHNCRCELAPINNKALLDTVFVKKLLKIIVVDSQLSKLNVKLKEAEDIYLETKKKIAHLLKQQNDQYVVIERLQRDAKLNGRPITPVKITRSVGLQVKRDNDPNDVKRQNRMMIVKNATKSTTAPVKPVNGTKPSPRPSVVTNQNGLEVKNVPGKTWVTNPAPIDNLTKVIHSVASGEGTISPVVRAPPNRFITLKSNSLMPIAAAKPQSPQYVQQDSPTVANTTPVRGIAQEVRLQQNRLLSKATLASVPANSISITPVATTTITKPQSGTIDLTDDDEQASNATPTTTASMMKSNFVTMLGPKKTNLVPLNGVRFVSTSTTTSSTTGQVTYLITGAGMGTKTGQVTGTPLNRTGNIIVKATNQAPTTQPRPANVTYPSNGQQVQSVVRPNTVVTTPQRITQQAPRVVKLTPAVKATPITHPPPLPDVLSQCHMSGWKLVPPRPVLKVGLVNSAQAGALKLSWSISDYDATKHAEIVSFQVYGYQQTNAAATSTLWRQIGVVRALPLPMACTMTRFRPGNKYFFAVRALDVHSRVSLFSFPQSIVNAVTS